MATDDLTAQQVRGVLDYNPDTGVFVRRSTGRPVGNRSGSGYITVYVLGKNRNAHRIAWLSHYGEWPANNIDHINGNRHDNRIANLRDITQSVNIQSKRVSKGRSGFVGVRYSTVRNKWEANIRPDGSDRQVHLGSFETPEAARAAYLNAKKYFHPHAIVGKAAAE